ncbi:MAG: hypothetical protein WCK98_01515 [bacterium]
MLKIKKISTLVTTAVLAFGLTLGGINTYAVAPNVSVTPAAAADSASNPIFGLDMTACLEVFDWAKKMADLNRGIAESNPYIKKDCVSQKNIASNGTRTVTKNESGQPTAVNYTVGATTVRKSLYNQFDVGSSATKTELGNLPVLGVFPGSNITAQALNSYDIDGTLKTTVANANRADLASLGSIYTPAQINSIYKTGGARTGMPRIPFTGDEKFLTEAGTGDPIYQGGYCKTVGGKITIRNVWAGPNEAGQQLSYPINIADYGYSPNSPIATCNWPNETVFQNAKLTDPDGLVKEQNLDVYQYIYKIPYPKDIGECNSLFPNVFGTYANCLSWFQNRYSLPFTGAATGNALYFTYTYYGVWDDIYTNWIGYTNPDINKARSTFTSNATLAQLRNYYGDDIPTLRRLFNDNTSSEATLIGRVDGASQAIKDAYRSALKDRFESFIQGADGYSVYAY